MIENTDQENFHPLDRMRLDGAYDEIRTLYLSDERPWIVGYSGGKDSTAALQLVWIAIRSLEMEKRRKLIYVVSSDTMVENPVVLEYIRDSLDRMRTASEHDGLPFEVHLVKPDLSQTFWVNLIGRGYAAPTRLFRWCTDRLKIQPANAFIKERIAYHGEAIIVLGVRKGESATRDQVLSFRQTNRMHLFSHTTFPNAFVYAPLRDFSLEDVWGYLMQQKSPWGADNYRLLSMYRDAQDGECPLVVDKTTPSCGNTRFGCWVCTLVSNDRSMENLIQSGEEWMDDLLEIRNFLYRTTDPAAKSKYRDYKHRNGKVMFKTNDESTIARGPYYLDVCATILRMTLRAQKKIASSKDCGNFQAITEDELRVIRRIWRSERGDWEDSVPRIYREETGSDLEWAREDIVSFNGEDEALLEKACKESDVPKDLVKKIIDMESVMQGLARRASIIKSMNKILSEEWRSEEEILSSNKSGAKT